MVAVLVVIVSLGAPCLLGAIVATLGGGDVMTLFGGVGGTILGLITTPIVYVAVAAKPVEAALALIYAPSSIAVLLTALATQGNPAISGLTGLLSVVGCSIVVNIFLRDRPKNAAGCRRCGYSLVGLDHDHCPECGQVQSEWRAWMGDIRSKTRDARSVVACWVFFIATLIGTACASVGASVFLFRR